jgi:hypothetical protein
VILTALGGIFLVSNRCIGIIRNSHNVAVASAILQERMEQLKAEGWEALTDSDSFTDQVWVDPEDGTTENIPGLLKSATKAGSAIQLPDILETVRVSAYRPAVGVTPVPVPISAKRTASAATLTSAATSLVDEKMIRVDVRVTWIEGQTLVPRSLGVTAIMARQ